MRRQLNLLMENSITLYGASGHGKVVMDILKSSTDAVITVIDDNPKSETILGLPVTKTSAETLAGLKNAIISIGNNKVRKRLSLTLAANFVSAIHKTAVVSKFSKVGKGTVVMAGVKINADAVIGEHCIINTGAVVEHDANIGNFAHISPAASLAGNVTVGEGTHVGIGAIVIQGVTIGKWATVGAGAIILKDIPDYAVVVGNPGKIIKYNYE
jgi:sugar O-acyltransferase (sialic acid O-acetyltransferase NeuD family)